MARNNEPMLTKPARLEPVYTSVSSRSRYYVTKSRLDGRGQTRYRLTVEEHIADWRYVVADIPHGYWIDLPRRGKPMLKRMR